MLGRFRQNVSCRHLERYSTIHQVLLQDFGGQEIHKSKPLDQKYAIEHEMNSIIMGPA